MKLSQIAQIIGCRWIGDTDVEIVRVAGIDEAGPGDLTFVSNRKYISHIPNTRASAIILGEDIPPVPIPSLRTDDPYLAFARALEIFLRSCTAGSRNTSDRRNRRRREDRPECEHWRVLGDRQRMQHRRAGSLSIRMWCCIPEVTVGDASVLHSFVIVREWCRIGNRVILQNGAVIGSDGFGFAPTKDGTFYKICQTRLRCDRRRR